MKVCFSTYPTAFQRPGGGEIVITQLRAALERLGVEVELFNLWRTSLATVDVLHHFATYGSESLALFRPHVRCLALTPTMWPELPGHVRLRREARRLARRALRRPLPPPFDAADVVFPVSRAEADLLVRNYHVPRERIAVVPNGVDTRFAAAPTGDFARTHGLGRYVLVPGRIDPVKNQLRVVSALADLDFDVVVLGDADPASAAYLAACRDAAGPRTRFVPALAYDSPLLVDAYAGAACVVVASEYETWSLAAHEAVLAGAAVACTSGGALPEHLGDAAEYFDPNSPAELRDAVARAVARSPRLDLRDEFLQRLSWDAVAETVLGAYEAVLGRR